MKIKSKLLLGLSTLPILLIIMVGIGRFQIATYDRMNDTLQTNYEMSILTEKIHTEIKDEAIILRNLYINSDESVINQLIQNMEEDKQSIAENIKLLETKVYSEEQKQQVEALIETNNNFITYSENVIQLILDGNKQEALTLIDERSKDIHEDFFRIISTITSTFETDMYSTFEQVSNEFTRELIIETSILAVCILFIMFFLLRNVWTLSTRLNKVAANMRNIADGTQNFTSKVEVLSNDEIDEVAKSFNKMAEALVEQRERETNLIWTKTNITDITTSLTGAKSLESLSKKLLSMVVPLVQGSYGVMYIEEKNELTKTPQYKLKASYALKERKHLTNTFEPGEGLVGQAVLEKTPIILTNVPSDYITVKSGLGEAVPVCIYVLPIMFEDQVIAVLELASFQPFSENYQSFLEELIGELGIIVHSVRSRLELANLLEETQALMEEIQAQSEELQSQQDELKATNEELEEQTAALRKSEERLQLQQEELEQSNVELEEKSKSLEEQNKRFEQKNFELERAKADLEEKANQLSLTSQYKSEFLANMSHELRTPLNSMLILSKLLADNSNHALSAKQVEYAKTIYASGNDLLALINDILDLAKIESGKLHVNPSKVYLSDIMEFVRNSFTPIANERNLSFTIKINKGIPEYIYIDQLRLQQVLKNLLSNAFKFTHAGGVTFEIGQTTASSNQQEFTFAITDTGIGVPKDKQELIFGAFQQADGTTSRKYGGTGLGLSISREMVELLGGKITIDSEEQKGSTFTFIVGNYQEQSTSTSEVFRARKEVATASSDVKEAITVRKVEQGEQQLVYEEENTHIKRLLIVDDDNRHRNSLMELIGEMDFIIKAVSSGKEAIEQLKDNSFDYLILDLGLQDTTGFELLGKIAEMKSNEMKIIIYTGRDLSSKEEYYLNQYSHTIIIKDVHSPKRLLEELNSSLTNSENEQNKRFNDVTTNLQLGLDGKKILLIDDDIRNVYALSSILENYGIHVTFAENGREGLDILQENTAFDIILMDIMMPEMDGYEAITNIRANDQLKNIPIIALTAKAMKGDREKCLAVGASDYIVKPVNPDQLMALIKVWID
ncbi:response regulator [Caldibacillus lycopersici]|uniref:Circadian input-output histidine kinase CikA n=1 Tax=Perspicuibacillus lycopersici TaxID=1325689 RepID=A0AAE3IQ60_9BACI|nr:response regulator [Perspicuibacillus lycopersici]MCU9612545.1 response regulator [Perspicuibacillus lycopersici]